MKKKSSVFSNTLHQKDKMLPSDVSGVSHQIIKNLDKDELLNKNLDFRGLNYGIYRGSSTSKIVTLHELFEKDNALSNDTKQKLIKLIHRYNFNEIVQKKLFEECIQSCYYGSLDEYNVNKFISIFDNQTVYNMIFAMENRLGGIESHLISIISENYDSSPEYIEILHTFIDAYQGAPLLLYTILKNAWFFGLIKNTEEALPRNKQKELNLHRVSNIFLDKDVVTMLLDEYQKYYFFLIEIKKIVLNNKKNEIMHYDTYLKDFFKVYCKTGQDKSFYYEGIQKLMVLKNYIESISDNDVSSICEDLFERAVEKKLITKKNKETQINNIYVFCHDTIKYITNTFVITEEEVKQNCCDRPLFASVRNIKNSYQDKVLKE